MHDIRPLKRGNVTIDNNLDVRYKGELQIVLKDIPNTGSSNVVASIVEEELFLLTCIQPWASFGFTK